jgi:hypothetical protein
MTTTPGALLTALLQGKRGEMTALAKKAGKSFQTIYNWTKDKGFGPDQRQLAAQLLGLPSDHFDHPDLVQQRETYRQTVLKMFRDHRIGKTLSPEEWRSIASFEWPVDVAPTVTRYWGLVLVMRGQLLPAEYQDSVDAVEQAVEQHQAKRVAASASKAVSASTLQAAELKTKRPQKRKRTHR